MGLESNVECKQAEHVGRLVVLAAVALIEGLQVQAHLLKKRQRPGPAPPGTGLVTCNFRPCDPEEASTMEVADGLLGQGSPEVCMNTRDCDDTNGDLERLSHGQLGGDLQSKLAPLDRVLHL